tara:strand:- start:839 stop:1951 length:1113 start_codon:yes stop_codon:yes gene_type:complete
MTKQINFTDVNPISFKEEIKINKEIINIIKKKNFILGDEVKIFEKNFSKLSKCKYAVGCASGTDALILSLMALNLKENDEVIVPGMTYISSGLSVVLNRNKLVLVDIDNETGLIAIDKIKKKITKKTKAIIPVNLYGQKVDLKKLRKVVGNKISIIEDSAQSHFAFNENTNKITSRNNYADTSCYSFYPAKNLGAFGDGGLISTNNNALYNNLMSLRNLGSVKKNTHLLKGINSRLDTIQSVVLNRKLKSILSLNKKRRKIANYYDKFLHTIKQIKLTKTNKGSSRHLYVIRTKKRDKLIKYLARKKIFCQMHYPYSLNKLPPIKKVIKKTKLENSERWAKECLSLPIHPKLTISEANRIVNEIKLFFAK